MIYHRKVEGNYYKKCKLMISFSRFSRLKRLSNKMKPCLVNKTSTSDEELQSNETGTHPGRSNEQPTHGILKVPSGKTSFARQTTSHSHNSGSTSPELHLPTSSKTKTKSKSSSPTSNHDNSSTTIGAPSQQHFRTRTNPNKKLQEQTIVPTTAANNPDRVTLVVDETRFVIDPQLFRAHPNTMLGRMFSTSWEISLVANERGEYDIANGISATIFRALLVKEKDMKYFDSNGVF